jgi:fibronectin type 3 domain-containing protein
VRTVAAEGPPFRESVSSPPATVDASDRFAPAAPTGLVAVQEASAVRLLWNPGAERDLDGYRVYRSAGGAEWVRLGEIVRQPSFLDADVKVGAVVRYRVTAVDRVAPPNESAPSSEVEVRVAADPSAGGR